MVTVKFSYVQDRLVTLGLEPEWVTHQEGNCTGTMLNSRSRQLYGHHAQLYGHQSARQATGYIFYYEELYYLNYTRARFPCRNGAVRGTYSRRRPGEHSGGAQAHTAGPSFLLFALWVPQMRYAVH